MIMHPVISNIISAIGYDEHSLSLVIVFNDGCAYEYDSVPAIIVNQLLASPSKGRFYNQFIKGRFNQLRIR